MTEADYRRFKLQNQLTESAPKIRHIEDYEIRMKQLTDAQKLWQVASQPLATHADNNRDGDLEKFALAQQEAEAWRGRCYQVCAPASDPDNSSISSYG